MKSLKNIFIMIFVQITRQIDLSIHYHSECKNTCLFILGCHIRWHDYSSIREKLKKQNKQNKKSENFDLIVQHIRCCYDDVRDGIPVYDDVAEMWNGKQNKWKSTILIY